MQHYAIHHDDAPPFISHALKLIRQYGLSLSSLGTPAWKQHVRAATQAQARASWLGRVALQPDLQLIYPPDAQLHIAGYLTMPTFRGRQRLTQLRINDEQAFTHCSDRQCTSCGVPETRAHLLLHCLALLHVRRAYEHLLPSLSMNTVANNSRLARLLSSPQAQPLTYEQMHRLRIVGNFIADLMYARGALIVTAGPLSLPFW